ncbi:MAG: thiamine pyrophosphate-dependent enzyme [Candidatus Shapirobacteria bacterium]|nr:thiamine pyrophosphate-dependent enzyme [Candidatus Shapirobacteria bacterium]
MKSLSDYRSPIAPTWCPGCNDYLFYAGLQVGLAALDIPTHKLVISFDIGCAGNMADFFKTYGIHTLHGRSVPTAMGIKMVKPELTVCVVGGDGGLYGEGLGHLIAAARANIDIKVFVSNNNLYSLTTGQTSPTTPKGSKTKSTPLGTDNLPIDGVALIKTVNPDVFAKRATFKNPLEHNAIIKEALSHQGFALVDISQICVTFGKQLNHEEEVPIAALTKNS